MEALVRPGAPSTAATTAGAAPHADKPSAELRRRLDLTAFIVSNAVSGERITVASYRGMSHFVTSAETKAEALHRAAMSCKHLEILADCGKRLGLAERTEPAQAQWRSIRAHVRAALRKRDLTACLIVQALMIDTMIIVLYRTLSHVAAPGTSRLLASCETGLFESGMRHIEATLQQDPRAVHDALIWGHRRVMPELFSVLGAGGGEQPHASHDDSSIDGIADPIERLRVGLLDTYIETLDLIGFDSSVTTPLIASMSSYDVQVRANSRLRTDGPCGRSLYGGTCC